MKLDKLIKSFFLLTSLTAIPATAENLKQIDYYGIASKDAEKNMLSMTENLFFTQLQEQNLNVSDKRYGSFSSDFFTSSVFFIEKNSTDSFYAVITKLENEKWELKLNLRNSTTGKTNSITKEYDSYYKILMESKNSINIILNELINRDSAASVPAEKKSENSGISLESLSGSWTGDQYMAKIVLMKVGRGFVVYKNGATMNISVKIQKDDNSILIEQTSGNNASYFPEIERKTALEIAIDAKPVSWIFTSYDGINLYGKKRTLAQESDGTIAEKELNTVWKKISQ